MNMKEIEDAGIRFGGFFLIILLALAAGCAVGPNYKRPAVNSPDNFRFAESQATNSFADLPWWEVFKDPMLQDLVRTALTNNYDLKQAVARVEQSRNLAIVARSAFFPQIGYSGNVGRGRNALYNAPVTLNGATESSVSASLNAAWEIDFWGRIRRMSQAAQAQYLATDQARRGVTITLMSDVATTYFQLLDLDQELEIQRAATNAYAGSYQIFNDRLVNGVASKLETDRAAAALANAAALIPQLELQIATTEDQLNVLLGRNPGPVPRSSLSDQSSPAPEIPAGLPSALLRRRPDVLQSEQLLIAANANIGVSIANFFPQIGLTTFLGRASPGIVLLHRQCGQYVERRRHVDRSAVPRRPVARRIPRFKGAIPGGCGRLPTDHVDGLRRRVRRADHPAETRRGKRLRCPGRGGAHVIGRSCHATLSQWQVQLL